MSDKVFPKAIMMKSFCAKIALNFHRTEEPIFWQVYEYYSTLNRKNEVIASVEKIDYKITNNLVVNDHIDLDEEHFLQLDD